MSLFKAQAMMRNLKQELSLAIAGASFVDSQDSNGMPITQISAGGESIFINIAVEDPNDGLQNAVGSAQPRYSPHQATILQDSTPTSLNVRYMVQAKVNALGAKTQVWEIHPLPGSYSLSGATLISTIYPDTINPLTNQQ